MNMVEMIDAYINVNETGNLVFREDGLLFTDKWCGFSGLGENLNITISGLCKIDNK